MKFSYMVVSNEVKGTLVTGLKGEYDFLFKIISENGFNGVELLIKNPFLVNFNEVKKYLKKYNLELPVICTGEIYGEDGLSFADSDPSIRKEAIKRTIETMKIAEEFNANVNVGRLRGRFVDGVKREDTIEWSKEGFLTCAESNRNVNLLLEPINHKVSNYVLTTNEGVSFIKDLNKPNIRLMLDYIHMMIENENLAESMMASEGCYDHVHVCDTDRKPLGLGSYNIEEFANLLMKSGYDGYVSIEAFDNSEYQSYLYKSKEILDRAFKVNKN